MARNNNKNKQEIWKERKAINTWWNFSYITIWIIKLLERERGEPTQKSYGGKREGFSGKKIVEGKNCLHHARKKTIRTGDFFCTEWFLLSWEMGFLSLDEILVFGVEVFLVPRLGDLLNLTSAIWFANLKEKWEELKNHLQRLFEIFAAKKIQF